jgi:anhydro-N-acetylmuramic acid kinase
VIAYQLNLSFPDILATATYFTAKTIEVNIRHFLPSLPEKLIVGGGGSYNLTLMKHLQSSLSNCQVLTNEDIGLNSSAKEAIAFAILGNETLSYQCNNVPTATGASHPVIMGKISM